MSNKKKFKKFVAIVLILTTFINISIFFYIKNATYQYQHQQLIMANELRKEKSRLSTIRIEFSKKYNYQELRKIALEKLKLKNVSVKQIENLSNVIHYYGEENEGI